MAGAAWNPVKQKLDETGATELAKQSYNAVAHNSKLAATKLNDATGGGLYAAGSMVKTGIGSIGSWFGYKPAPSQPVNEESKEHDVIIDKAEAHADPQD